MGTWTGLREMNGDVSFAPRKRGLARGWGGLAAMAYPAALVLLALNVGFRSGGDMADPATSFLGAVLFLVASPTAWVFAFDFIDVTRFTVIALGIITSFPLWYLVGGALADVSMTWRSWLARFATVAIGWTMATIFFLAVIASLA